jgi:probable HAF family extracellular repeat protein
MKIKSIDSHKTTLNILALGLMLSIPQLTYADFKFTTIDVPKSTATNANGNSTKKIVGAYRDTEGNAHGFILDKKGEFRKVDEPNATDGDIVVPTPGGTTLNEINEKDQMAGTFGDGKRLHGFFLDNGKFITLDPPNSIRSQGGGINNRGQVAGSYRTSDNKRHGYLWRNGVFTIFNVPGDHPLFGTVPLGNNDRGQIVGNYVEANGGNTGPNEGRHGFLLSKGIYIQLDFPGAAFTVAQGINNQGEIVGQYFDDLDGSIGHGFLRSNKGIYTSIDLPNATFTAAFSINDKGQFVGSYDDVDGNTHGYVGVLSHKDE